MMTRVKLAEDWNKAGNHEKRPDHHEEPSGWMERGKRLMKLQIFFGLLAGCFFMGAVLTSSYMFLWWLAGYYLIGVVLTSIYILTQVAYMLKHSQAIHISSQWLDWIRLLVVPLLWLPFVASLAKEKVRRWRR